MSIKSRLDKLEQERGVKGGCCPGCGFRQDAIRTIEMRPHPQCQPGGTVDPPEDFCPEFVPQPGRPLCPVCGDFMPPVAFINVYRRDSAGAGEPEA